MEAVRLEPSTTSPLPDLFAEVPAWYPRARCLDADPAMFFPDGKGASAREAKAVCAGCPVVADCREYAMAVEAEDAAVAGVWGGLSPQERKRLRRPQ